MLRIRTASHSALILAYLLLAEDPTLLCRSTSAPYSSSTSSSKNGPAASSAAAVGERRAKADSIGPQRREMASSATALDFREMMRKERELMLKMARKDSPASGASAARCLSRRTRPGLKPKYRVSSCGGGVDGIHYVPDFVTADEGRLLQQAARNKGGGDGGGGGGEWKDLHKRRLQIHGGTPHPSGMVEEELPLFLREVCEALVAAGIFPENAPPNHVLLNEYSEGQGIGPHKDGPLYEGRVAILSLGSEAKLDFWGSLEDARADCADIAAAAAATALAATDAPLALPASSSSSSSSSSSASSATAAAATGPAACDHSAAAAVGSAAAAEGRIPRAAGDRWETRSARSLTSVTCEDCSLVVFEGQAYHDVWHGIASTGSAAVVTPPTPPAAASAAETRDTPIETVTAAAPTTASGGGGGGSGVGAAGTSLSGGDSGRGSCRGGGSAGGGGVGGSQKRLSFTIRRVARVVPADSVMEHPEARSEMERRRRGFERAVTETAAAETSPGAGPIR